MTCCHRGITMVQPLVIHPGICSPSRVTKWSTHLGSWAISHRYRSEPLPSSRAPLGSTWALANSSSKILVQLLSCVALEKVPKCLTDAKENHNVEKESIVCEKIQVRTPLGLHEVSLVYSNQLLSRAWEMQKKKKTAMQKKKKSIWWKEREAPSSPNLS